AMQAELEPCAGDAPEIVTHRRMLDAVVDVVRVPMSNCHLERRLHAEGGFTLQDVGQAAVRITPFDAGLEPTARRPPRVTWVALVHEVAPDGLHGLLEVVAPTPGNEVDVVRQHDGEVGPAGPLGLRPWCQAHAV